MDLWGYFAFTLQDLYNSNEAKAKLFSIYVLFW